MAHCSLTDLRRSAIVNHMVEYSIAELDITFGALSDPTRRALLTALSFGEATVSELAEPHKISLAAVSKHIQILERAGLVHRRRAGRIHYISLEASPMLGAFDWLAAYQDFWDESLDTLVGLLEKRS
jgi:DNA-binding transcriptional ArsR family regulator